HKNVPKFGTFFYFYSMNTFLRKLSESLISKTNSILSNTTVVLPNRRAKIFLINEIKNNSSETVFAPEIYSIQEFMEQVSGLRTLSSVELLFESYKVYSQITTTQERQSFEQFGP